MKKIPSLFLRNVQEGGDRLVRNEVTPGAEWVIAGEGIPTRKFDGTCCLIERGNLYRRYELKKGKDAPEGFKPAQDPDPVTGDTPGWIPVREGKEDQWHREAFGKLDYRPCSEDGTYELVGPKVNGNPEKFPAHGLVRHGSAHLPLSTPRTFDGLKTYLLAHPDIEGIVWHHPDGRMVKIKRKDFAK